MLPEAYDPEGSGDVVRHWFALPGAVLGALVLEHAARGSCDRDALKAPRRRATAPGATTARWVCAQSDSR